MHDGIPKQQSWLATIVFTFTALYQHLSLSLDPTTLLSLSYFIGGIIASKLLLDVPGQWLQNLLHKKSTVGKTGEEKNRGEDKAAAICTFVKAAQVILALVVAKLIHQSLF